MSTESPEPLTGLPTGTLQNVDHVAIVVRDAGRAADELSAILGLTIAFDEVLPERAARLYYLTSNPRIATTTQIQLVEPTGPGPVKDFLDQNGEGLHHVCFAVTDLEATLEIVEPSTRDSMFSGGRGRRCAFLDVRPHGLLVELIEVPAIH